MCVNCVGLHAVQTRHRRDPDSMPRAGWVTREQDILEQLIVKYHPRYSIGTQLLNSIPQIQKKLETPLEKESDRNFDRCLFLVPPTWYCTPTTRAPPLRLPSMDYLSFCGLGLISALLLYIVSMSFCEHCSSNQMYGVPAIKNSLALLDLKIASFSH
jgi:hypothetical protein